MTRKRGLFSLAPTRLNLWDSGSSSPPSSSGYSSSTCLLYCALYPKQLEEKLEHFKSESYKFNRLQQFLHLFKLFCCNSVVNTVHYVILVLLPLLLVFGKLLKLFFAIDN